MTTLVAKVQEAIRRSKESYQPEFLTVLSTLIAFAVDRIADQMTSLVLWASTIEVVKSTFGRQALPMTWDFAEAQPFAGSAADVCGAVEWIARVCEHLANSYLPSGQVQCQSATDHSLPNDSADAVVTDPPYYYSVPYADLADFFYVWLRRSLEGTACPFLESGLTPKELEVVQNLPHSDVSHLQKDRQFYERHMTLALAHARRIAKPGSVSIIVFAHNDTDAWEAMLSAVVTAGWMVTGSWPVDTERAARTIAQRQSTLASSVHLVCRPREKDDGSLSESVGEWREVLDQLPKRIHDWMPRLASEGVVGADAIFACLGPALEIFSRYSRVEKASGEVVSLRDYLEQVWAAVSREALSMVFKEADASGLEPDARLTAMILWTLGAGAVNGKAEGGRTKDESEDEAEEEEDSSKKSAPAAGGFTLEYDAARKIAQGLGAHLEQLTGVVEVKGDKARLLSVAERTKILFGNDSEAAPGKKRGKKKERQPSLFEALGEIEEEAGGWSDATAPSAGKTALDRIHQSMILFAAGRSEALKRFLVEDGVGKDARFWRLAQSLSALYPTGTDEKRWIDGVLARKKGLGF